MWDMGFIKFAKEQGIKLTKAQKEAAVRILDALPKDAGSGRTTLLQLLVKFDGMGGIR